MKNRIILFVLFCLFTAGLQVEGANNKHQSFSEISSCLVQGNSDPINRFDFGLTQTIFDEVIENLDTEAGIRRKGSALQLTQNQYSLSGVYSYTVLVRLLLLQQYTDLPPPVCGFKNHL